MAFFFLIGQLSISGLLQGASLLVVLNSYKNGRTQTKIQVIFVRTHKWVLRPARRLESCFRRDPHTSLGGVLTRLAHQAQLFMVALKEEEDMLQHMPCWTL